MKQIKKLKELAKGNDIKANVAEWLLDQLPNYDNKLESVFKDLFHGGCSSGIVNHLIYYRDTLAFFETHKVEINELLVEMLNDLGTPTPGELFGEAWDIEDPLAFDTSNQNLLAWFGFEEVARQISNDFETEN